MAPRKLTTTDQSEPIVVTEDNVPDVPEITPPSDNLFSALVKAQLEFAPIVKDKINPHYKSKYADLGSIMDAIRVPLLKNNLVITSFFNYEEESTYLVTVLTHATSGESIEIEYKVNLSGNEQAKGSVQTYARRYSICALLNLVADDDDDGNAAVAAKPVEIQPLPYSKKECLEWAKTHTPYSHVSDEERSLKFDSFAKKGHYDTAGKWKILCWENRDRYNPNKSTGSEVVK